MAQLAAHEISNLRVEGSNPFYRSDNQQVMKILDRKSFEEPIWIAVKNRPLYIRRGQQVFNSVGDIYGVAREVQFDDGIDCFYDDSQIEPFLDAAYTRWLKHSNEGAKPAKWLYRLESITPENGLWYNEYGDYCFGIGKLVNCKTKDLPMDYDERYHKDGKQWFSSCSNVEDLAHWYSLEDAKELIDNGFVFTKYLATDYEEYENQTCFLIETSLRRQVISFEELEKLWKDN